MSYPLNLQPLVIEDDEGAKEAYQGIFDAIAKDWGDLPLCPGPPSFAFSYEEALDCLNGSKIFHVAILDLRLPEKPKMPAIEDNELGLNLLTQCIERDRYPIPSLLVISGHIGSSEQTRMQETLREGFYYGRQCVKGGGYGLLQEEIRKACKEAIRYCAVGIHLRDSGNQQYPTITPREEDLVRRSVLQQHGAIGVDLTWWSADRLPTDPLGAAAANHWTKVLMGRFLLDGGRGASRPQFFKLIEGSGAKFVIDSARHVENKLSHIKVTSVTAKSTALIVTEKVGSHDARPISLEEFFKECKPDQAFGVAGQVVHQVQQLGDLLSESKPLKKIFRPWLDVGILSEQWQKFGGQEIQQQLKSDIDPIELFKKFAASDDKIRIKERSLVHGDLHVSNVALDAIAGRPEAYIFDPGVVTRDVAGRDLAVLEVSVILHLGLPFDTVSQICAAVYGSSSPLTKNSGASVDDSIGKSVVEFVRGLREGAEQWNDADIYALMVFDFALIQVGGLAFGLSGNKISDARSAIYLLASVARWCDALRKQKPD